MGAIGRVYLASPYIALAVAVVGCIVGDGQMVGWGATYIIGFKTRAVFGNDPEGFLFMLVLVFIVSGLVS